MRVAALSPPFRNYTFPVIPRYKIDRIKMEDSTLASSGPSGRVKRTALVRLSPRPRVSVLQPINKRFARITCATNDSRTRKQAWHLHRCATAIEEVPQETMCGGADFPPKRKADDLVHDPASASDPLGSFYSDSLIIDLFINVNVSQVYIRITER